MHPKRRSGRIAKELPVVLLGTDTTGKVFAEETKTVVLSRHGAGVLSRYRFAPDEILTLRLPGTAKEAEVRLVGQIGGEPGRYVHGLALVDPNLDFWPMEFPPPEAFEPANRQVSLECTACQRRQMVEHGEIEEDVYSVNESVLRFCDTCGISTAWTKARGEASPTVTVDSASQSRRLESATLRPTISYFAQNTPSPTDTYEPVLSGPSGVYSGASAYSGAAVETVTTSTAALPADEFMRHEAASPATLDSGTSNKPAVRPLDPGGRPVNRRKHMRVRVSFTACVKLPLGATDIVECENMSKGGLCFHSRKQYAPGSTIEIAAPFSPGTPALFLLATIKRAEPLGDGPFFRYGVAYAEPKRA